MYWIVVCLVIIYAAKCAGKYILSTQVKQHVIDKYSDL